MVKVGRLEVEVISVAPLSAGLQLTEKSWWRHALPRVPVKDLLILNC